MKTYLIDAYNYVFKKIVDTKLEVNSGLQRFLTILDKLSSKSVNSFVVFIDGKDEITSLRIVKDNLSCVFSSKESNADSEIIKYIENNPSKSFFVVTDDIELRQRAKSLKCKLLSCDEFATICEKAVAIANDKENEVENESYILQKRNPVIPNDEVEKLFEEFSKSDDINI